MVIPVQENSGKNSQCSRRFDGPDYMSIDYNTKFQKAFDCDDEEELFKLFGEQDWLKYLRGYKFKEGKKGYRPVSFPLLDLIKRHPSVAYSVFSKLIEIEVDRRKRLASQDEDFIETDGVGTDDQSEDLLKPDELRLDELHVKDCYTYNATKVTLKFEELEKTEQIQKLMQEVKFGAPELRGVKFRNLRPIDQFLLNPVTQMLKENAENLYAHPLIENYVLMRMKKDMVYIWLYISLIINIGLMVCLTGFAFSLPSIASNSTYNMETLVGASKLLQQRTFCPMDSPCWQWRIASAIFIVLRFSLLIASTAWGQIYFCLTSSQSFDREVGVINLIGACIQLIVSIIYITTMNPYFGIFALAFWLMLFCQLHRLPLGTNIHIVKRVFCSALSLAHILIIFVCAVGSICHVVHGNFDMFKRWYLAIPYTIQVLMGQFDAETFILDGQQVFGHGEFLYIIFMVLLLFGCNIILMNIYIGLAVGDVQEVKEEAHANKTIMQMKLVANNFASRPFFMSRQRRAMNTTIHIIDNDKDTLMERLKRFYHMRIKPTSDSYTRKRKTLEKWMKEIAKHRKEPENLSTGIPVLSHHIAHPCLQPQGADALVDKFNELLMQFKSELQELQELKKEMKNGVENNLQTTLQNKLQVFHT